MLKLAVIGDPIEHSLSPEVHGAALDFLGIEYEYEKVRVAQGGLLEFIDYAKKSGINGFNLTMPHKVDILPFLDEIDEEADAFSSVNTVHIRDGKLCGYSTDALGYRLSLEMIGYGFKHSRVVILGAGGVVRTLALAAARDGAESITILNRTAEKAEIICNEISGVCGNVKSGGFSFDEIAEQSENADILINATPLGMSGCNGKFDNLGFLDCVDETALVSDLIYNPSETEFLYRARRNGNKTLNGLGMLIYQALASDEVYLGRKIDIHSAYDAVEKSIK